MPSSAHYFSLLEKRPFSVAEIMGVWGGPSENSDFHVIIDNRLTAGNRCEMYFKLILGA